MTDRKFTGFVDKNKKEILDKDLIIIDGKTWEIRHLLMDNKWMLINTNFPPMEPTQELFNNFETVGDSDSYPFLIDDKYEDSKEEDISDSDRPRRHSVKGTILGYRKPKTPSDEHQSSQPTLF